jgi:hypothetical protein
MTPREHGPSFGVLLFAASAAWLRLGAIVVAYHALAARGAVPALPSALIVAVVFLVPARADEPDPSKLLVRAIVSVFYSFVVLGFCATAAP